MKFVTIPAELFDEIADFLQGKVQDYHDAVEDNPYGETSDLEADAEFASKLLREMSNYHAEEELDY